MATISVVWEDEKGEGGLVVTLSNEVHNLNDLTLFISQMYRAVGFSQVSRAGISTERGEEVWSKI